LALAPLAFPASKEIMELQRDMSLLTEQVRNMQRAQDEEICRHARARPADLG